MPDPDDADAPPTSIFVIRHVENPVTIDGTTYNGVDVTGTINSDCLIPKGWQRAGGRRCSTP